MATQYLRQLDWVALGMPHEVLLFEKLSQYPVEPRWVEAEPTVCARGLAAEVHDEVVVIVFEEWQADIEEMEMMNAIGVLVVQHVPYRSNVRSKLWVALRLVCAKPKEGILVVFAPVFFAVVML